MRTRACVAVPIGSGGLAATTQAGQTGTDPGQAAEGERRGLGHDGQERDGAREGGAAGVEEADRPGLEVVQVKRRCSADRHAMRRE